MRVTRSEKLGGVKCRSHEESERGKDLLFPLRLGPTSLWPWGGESIRRGLRGRLGGP